MGFISTLSPEILGLLIFGIALISLPLSYLVIRRFSFNKEKKVERAPCMLLTDLAEYLTAAPTHRRQLISEQKHDNFFDSTDYRAAKSIICDYILEGMASDQNAMNALREFMANKGRLSKKYGNVNKPIIADAVTSFIDLTETLQPHLKDTKPILPEREDEYALYIGQLEVFIDPEIILVDEQSNEIVGAIKLQFRHTRPLSDTNCEYASLILQPYLKRAYGVNANPAKCIVVDIPSGSIKTSPKIQKPNWREIEAAAQEIVERWPKI